MKIRYILYLSLSLLTVACAAPDSEDGVVDHAVNFVVGMDYGMLSSRTTPVNGNTTAWKSGDVIGISKTVGGSTTSSQYRYNGPSWTVNGGSSPLIWSMANVSNTFKAWYPSTASYTTFTLPTDQSTAAKIATADYMRGTTTCAYSLGGTVNLSMQRKTVLLIFNIKSIECGSNPSITALNVTSAYSQYTGESNVSGTSVAVTPLNYVKSGASGSVGKVGSTYAAIIIPCYYYSSGFTSATPFLSITVKDNSDLDPSKTRTFKLVYPPKNLVGGYSYEFDVSLSDMISLTCIKEGYPSVSLLDYIQMGGKQGYGNVTLP